MIEPTSEIAPTAAVPVDPVTTGQFEIETAERPQSGPAVVQPPSVGAAMPERLGPYRIVRTLGHGGMGAVYLAVDENLDREVAVKVMLPHFATIPAARERFVREARAAARVKSDHVVTIYQVGDSFGIPFIAMEFLHGQPLDGFLKATPEVPIPTIVRIARDVASGLADAHALGLVHRDIKPANLWLESPSNRVKILDFGLARKDSDSQLTAAGAAIGTPAFMSPEQARGDRVDARTDLFSLGGVLYLLCTGKLPFPGTSQIEVLSKLATDKPAAVDSLNAGVPTPLAELIHRLLAKHPDDRPESAISLVAALDSLSGIESKRAEVAGATNDSGRMPNRTRTFATATVVGATLALAAWATFSRGPMEPPSTATAPPTTHPTTLLPPVEQNPDRVAFEWAVNWNAKSVGITSKDGGYTVFFPAEGKPPPVPPYSVNGLNFEGNRKLADADVPPLQSLAKLDSVVFSSTNLGNSAIAAVAGVPLRHLYLSSTKVDDDGLKALAACPNLETLHLDRTAVTDAGLEHLRGMTSLRELRVECEKVSGAAVEKLAARLPECRISYLDGEAKPSVEVERRVAAVLIETGTVTVRFTDNKTQNLVRKSELPKEPFVVVGYTGAPMAEKAFDAMSLIRTIGPLRSLDRLSGIRLEPEHLEALTKSPAAASLRVLFADLPLNATTLELLSKLPNLRNVGLDASTTDDALLKKFVEARNWNVVGLAGLGRTGRVTAKGWAEIHRLPLEVLVLNDCTAFDSSAAKELASMKTLTDLFLESTSLDERTLAAVAESNSLKILQIDACRLPGVLTAAVAGGTSMRSTTFAPRLGLHEFERLVPCRTLTVLSITGSQLSEAEQVQLSEAMPNCEVELEKATMKNGKVIARR